jgi:hypothetical protein
LPEDGEVWSIYVEIVCDFNVTLNESEILNISFCTNESDTSMQQDAQIKYYDLQAYQGTYELRSRYFYDLNSFDV